MKKGYEQVENILHNILNKIVQSRFCKFGLDKLLFSKRLSNMVRCTRHGCKKEFCF